MLSMGLVLFTQKVEAPMHEAFSPQINLSVEVGGELVEGQGEADVRPESEEGDVVVDEDVVVEEEEHTVELPEGFVPPITEEEEALIDEAMTIIDQIFSWVMVAFATLGLPALILFGMRFAKAFRDLRGKQEDGNIASKELIRIFGGMYDTEQEQAKAMAAIITLSNFDALKKEKLLNDIADPTISFEEMKSNAIDNITDNQTATSAVKSVFEDIE